MRFVGLIAMLAAVLAGPAMAQDKTPETTAAATASKQRYTPPPTTDLENTWLLDLSTGGRVSIWLRPDVAPDMVRRIKNLTRRKFYDGLTFHRVIDGFMAQGGDPQGDGTGGSDLPDVKAEFNYLPHVRGAVAAARAQDENSANSQFYIMLMPRLSLDNKYTVFGRVLQGMQYVDAIEKGEPPANPTRILHAYIAADNPPPYQAAPAAQLPTLDAPATLPGAKSKTPSKPRR
ncbi:peptidylprolyl isomerase [Sphingomonas dokdonensis]|uniref:Peptidyl-prolyl cis-trans isomerase n=1 Tax=Sphingomonas dokdonensis TaxID=344880 RepID=A0A245ZKI3_9SPHN|nr:peptidylprolyl isomerase [Sphingomonas dokdonensis]OWK30260.1 peptidyl-prolyl cis-trans isomerase B [Sphingomonas dokdonensis]